MNRWLLWILFPSLILISQGYQSLHKRIGIFRGPGEILAGNILIRKPRKILKTYAYRGLQQCYLAWSVLSHLPCMMVTLYPLSPEARGNFSVFEPYLPTLFLFYLLALLLSLHTSFIFAVSYIGSPWKSSVDNGKLLYSLPTWCCDENLQGWEITSVSIS